MAKKGIKLDSMNQLQKLMPKLLAEHGENKKLMKAALSNPILALEEIGYTVAPNLKLEIEDKVRFDLKKQKRLSEIKSKVHSIAGMKTDINSTTSVAKTLEHLFPKETVSVGKKIMQTSAILLAAKTTLKPQIFQKKGNQDPLSNFKSTHEIIPLLVEYRQIEASAPRLASKQLFNSILVGKKLQAGINIGNVKFKMQERSKRKNQTSSPNK